MRNLLMPSTDTVAGGWSTQLARSMQTRQAGRNATTIQFTGKTG